ncbi:MAG: ArnT family glycosyltransferase [Thermoplasmata archaeon]
MAVSGIWFFLSLNGALGVDEVAYAEGASFLMYGGPVANLEHPPLAKIFISLGYLVFGRSSLGWRIVTPFFALAAVYLTYKIGVLLDNRKVGFFASLALVLTHLYSSHAVMAMLDVYLAFFVVLLLFLMLSYFREYDTLSAKQEKIYLLGLGVASSSAFLCKYYGLLFVAAVCLVLLWKWRRDPRPEGEENSPSMLARVGFFLLGFGIVAMLAYIPVLMRIGEVISYLDAAGGYSSQLVTGHRIIVAGAVYDIPPIWTYVYWLWEYGGWLYVLGLIALLHGLYDCFGRRTPDWQKRGILVAGLVPFVGLSLLSVKFPRYLIPILPILALSAMMLIWSAVDTLLVKISLRKAGAILSRTNRLVSVGLMVFIILVPFSPIYTTMQEPDIGNDSGYDIAARIVQEHVVANSTRTVVVYSWYGAILTYYLQGSNLDNLIVEDLDFFSTAQYSELENSSVDLVVDLEHQPRFDTTPTYELVHGSHVGKQHVKGDLYIYFMV